jgi:NADPH:quinone reductase
MRFDARRRCDTFLPDFRYFVASPPHPRHPMLAIEISQFGGPEVLKVCERPMPVAGKGEVLVRVSASGINRPDVFQRVGNYAPPPGASDLPGLEIAGEIVAGDLDSADNRWQFKKGDHVCALLQGGGYAQYAVVPLLQCLPVPGSLSDIEAASLPENYFTVWSNVMDRAGLGRGEGGESEVLLVQGGTSGIGVAAVQIAAALGHRVFATAGSDDKCRAVEALGAERGINYRTEDFVEVVKELTHGDGADVVLDMVAGDYVPRELKVLAEGGRLCLIATLGGARTELPLADIMRRRLTITGSTLRPRPVAFKGAIAARLYEHVWPLLASGRVRPVIYKVFPAAQAADAHTLMESSTHIGKIMLEW